MRKIQNIFIVLSLLFTASCVGQKDTASDYSLTISVSQPNVSVDQSESIQILVKNHSVDVTEQSEIFYTSGDEEIIVPSGIFTATQSGEYTFSARYEGVETDTHAVVYAYTSDELTDEYYRRNLVMKFTGTWCKSCPNMGEAIIEAEHALPNRIVEMALHISDVLKTDEGAQIASDNKFEVLPIAFIDMNGYTKQQSATNIINLISSSIELNPTVAGVRIDSSLSGSSLTVEVGVKASAADSYKVAVALVTDNYNYAQTGADDPNYKQNKVLRFFISDLYGDSVTLDTDTESTLSYSVTVPDDSLASESRIIAYVLNEVNGSYIVNNATECVIGKSIDYIYEIAE